VTRVQRRATLRFGRSLQALSVAIKEPAVKKAAQAAILEPAEGEIGTAVGTIAIEQSQLPRSVPEQHQMPTHDLHGPHRARPDEFLCQGDGLPVAAQEYAGRCAFSSFGDQLGLGLVHR